MNQIEGRFLYSFFEYVKQKPVFSVYHNYIDYDRDEEKKTFKIADCTVEPIEDKIDNEYNPAINIAINCHFYGISRDIIKNPLIFASLDVQYRTPSYTIDFLLSSTDNFIDNLKNKLGIEIDGHEWHEKNKEQAASDKKRERDLLLGNIHIIRYTGSEAYTNPEKCVEESLKIFISMCYWKIREHESFYEDIEIYKQKEFDEIMESKNGK